MAELRKGLSFCNRLQGKFNVRLGAGNADMPGVCEHQVIFSSSPPSQTLGLTMSGIPVKLLNEAQGHIVLLELTTGDTYRGKLLENEDNMNLSLYDVTITKGRTGATSYMNQVFVRGSMIRFVAVPDILKNAPMFFVKPSEKPKPPVRGPPPKRQRN